MTFRDSIKRAIPDSLYRWLRLQKHKANLEALYHRQALAFAGYAAISIEKSQEQLASWLIFLSHRIEKGLSHSDFRACFGKQTLEQMSKCLHLWIQGGFPNEAFEFRVATAALKAYRDRHLENGFPLPEEYVKGFAGMSELIESADNRMSGAVEVKSGEGGVGRSYSETLLNRHSIREYAPEPPNSAIVFEAIDIAMSAPSVCNRQSQRVTIVCSPDKVRRVLDAQGGWSGYAYPPLLLIVTSSLSSFVSSTERNEPYVDGGIFTMALLGALEWKGLAACPLNAMFELGNERLIRKTVDIPNSEVMICIVAVGNRPESILCPRSARKGASDVVRYA